LQSFLKQCTTKSLLILIVILINRIDCISQQWLPVGKGFSNAVNSLFADLLDGKVFASGSFYFTDTMRVNGVAVWDGFKWDSLGSGASWVNNGSAITKYQNQIYTDAGFTNHTTPINCGGKFNGQDWDTLSYGVSGDIRDLYELNGELICFFLPNEVCKLCIAKEKRLSLNETTFSVGVTGFEPVTLCL
jgi:hypothetical protein